MLASRTIVARGVPASFSLASAAGAVRPGSHRVEVRWVREGKVVARSARTV